MVIFCDFGNHNIVIDPGICLKGRRVSLGGREFPSFGRQDRPDPYVGNEGGDGVYGDSWTNS